MTPAAVLEAAHVVIVGGPAAGTRAASCTEGQRGTGTQVGEAEGDGSELALRRPLVSKFPSAAQSIARVHACAGPAALLDEYGTPK